MITEIVAAIAISAKNTPHAVFTFFRYTHFIKVYFNVTIICGWVMLNVEL